MESIWHRTAKLSPKPSLKGNLAVDAAVIGGGLAGVLTASLLWEAGLRTVVLEADRAGSGQTGNTTAKVTAQHGDIYCRLEESLGPEAAALYAEANQKAVEQYETMIRKRNISCGWERLPAWLYSRSGENTLAREAEAQKRAGLPAGFAKDAGLPFPIKGAVRCEGQAQFHPLEFLFSLADNLEIYEGTRVLEVEGDQLRTSGGLVRAKHIMFACHFPFVNAPGYYFLRMHQERSYAVALRGGPELEGMYYSVDPGGLSLRRAGEYLLVGGGSHRTGENQDGGKYEALSRSAGLLFPEAKEAARWSAQDCVTLDGVPYIGQFSASTPSWYVATGFGKWGMTHSMVAAQLLRDQILGRENPYAGIFSPQRFTPAASAGQLLSNGLHAVRDLGRELLAPARGAAGTLPPGRGGVVELEGEKVGVYRTADGEAYIVDIRCPHLGCQLEWNPDEKSWDCPCHGSRFDERGRLLCGPAQQDLWSARIEEL